MSSATPTLLQVCCGALSPIALQSTKIPRSFNSSRLPLLSQTGTTEKLVQIVNSGTVFHEMGVIQKIPSTPTDANADIASIWPNAIDFSRIIQAVYSTTGGITWVADAEAGDAKWDERNAE